MICLFNIFYDQPYPLLEFASKLISNGDDSQVLQAFISLHFVPELEFLNNLRGLGTE
jgi:hypothetical protein